MKVKRKTLKESVIEAKGQSDWDLLVAEANRNPFFRKFAKELAKKRLAETEGTLQGAVSTETDATGALGEVYAQIIMGIEEYAPLTFARIFRTDKMRLDIPVGTYGTVSERAAGGTFAAAEKTTANVTVTLDKEYGGNFSWTKAYIEDAVWDTLAEQNQAAGYEMQKKLCERLLRPLQDIDAASLAGAAHVAIANQSAITWAEFLAMVAAVDIAGTGPATHVLVSPKKYWQLMALDQFVSSLYAGDDATVRSGILKTTMGVTVMRVSDMGDIIQVKYDAGAVANLVVGEAFTNGGEGGGTSAGFILADSCISGTFGGSDKVGLCTLLITSGTTLNNDVLTGAGTGTIVVNGAIGAWSDIIAVNSKKAIALVYRRDPEIEPYAYPDENRYGFTLSCRAKVGALVPAAVAVGLCAAA